jgi:nitroreductase
MNYIEMMNKRTSVRTFSREEPLGEEILEKIKKIVTKSRKGPFGKTFTFSLMDTEGSFSEDPGKMSSYGIIKGGRYYFGGYSDPDDRSIIDFGYCFEEAILELTALNLGTCGLGGTFGRSYIGKLLKLPEGKVIPAISPVGHSFEKQTVKDKLVRLIAGSKNRKPYNKLFFNHLGEESLQAVIPEDLRSPLNDIFNAVRIAPSASNKQPWRIVIQDNLFHFFWDFDKNYNGASRGYNIQALDMGLALCHFRKAAEELRLGGKFSYADPHLENVEWQYVLSWKVKG